MAPIQGLPDEQLGRNLPAPLSPCPLETGDAVPAGRWPRLQGALGALADRRRLEGVMFSCSHNVLLLF